MKGHPELDDERNLMLVGRKCHTDKGLVNNYFVRMRFWSMQCKRYGVESMRDWYSKVNLKIKENFE